MTMDFIIWKNVFTLLNDFRDLKENSYFWLKKKYDFEHSQVRFTLYIRLAVQFQNIYYYKYYNNY